MAWSIFHAKKYISPKAVPDISAMLPICRDNSKSPATIKHFLDVLAPAIDYLNPEQPMVVAFTLLQNDCNGISLTSMDTKS